MFSLIQPAPVAFHHVPFSAPSLTARDANTCPDFSRSMASLVKLSGSEKDVTSGKRVYKHPIFQRREGEQSGRRQAFLRKVKENSDDSRWQTRSDQVRSPDTPEVGRLTGSHLVDPTARLLLPTTAVARGAGANCSSRTTGYRGRGRNEPRAIRYR